MFYLQDINDIYLENTPYIYNDMICPALLELIIKSNPRICLKNMIWISPNSTT